MESVGKLLMLAAGVIFVAGGLVFLLGRLTGGLLPGDLVVRRGSFTLVFPVVASIVVSVVLTVVLNIVFRR